MFETRIFGTVGRQLMIDHRQLGLKIQDLFSLRGLGGPGTAVPMAVVMAGFTTLALITFLTLARPRSPAAERCEVGLA